MTEPRAGLRERKKEDARRQIIHKANRLFRKHGYEGVTLEQIADACVMSVRTILRYFSTKEALALAVEHDLLESFRSRLANRETDAVTCWRDFQVETLHLMESAEARQRMIAIFSTSATLAEFSLIGQTYQDILADAIAEESGDVPPLETAVFATLFGVELECGVSPLVDVRRALRHRGAGQEFRSRLHSLRCSQAG